MKKSLLYVNLAIALGGLTALFPKVIDLPADVITFVRSLFAALSIYGFLRLHRKNLDWPNKRNSLEMLALGCLLGLHWVTYFQAIQISTVAIGMIALYTYPVITVLLEPLLADSHWNIVDIILGVVVFIGVFLLVPDFDLLNNVARGVIWGVISAIFFSVRTIYSRRYVQQFSGPMVMLFQFSAAAIVTIPFLFDERPNITVQNWLFLLILGVIFTAVAHTLLNMSLEKLKAKSMGIIAASQPIYGTIFAAILLGELPSVRTLVGGCIVVGVAVFEGFRSFREDDNL